MAADFVTYSQLTNADKALSIFSMGGHWNCNSMTVASAEFSLVLSSHLFKASLIVVAFAILKDNEKNYKKFFDRNYGFNKPVSFI